MSRPIMQWINLIPAIKSTVKRFPLPFLASISATFCVVLMIHYPNDWQYQPAIIKTLLASLYALFLLTSLRLTSERLMLSKGYELAGNGLVLAGIAAYTCTSVDINIFASFAIFMLASFATLLFAPYLKSHSSDGSFWYFNFQTLTAITFALAAAIILGLGIILSLASIGYLFELKISGKIYADTWAICFLFMLPCYVLSNLATTFDYEDKSCEFPKGISVIANYILMPLMLLYFVILYSYVGKIALESSLPKGNLSWMITLFGCLGIITKLISYPLVNQGTLLLRLFDRYYYHVLLLPIAMLFIAIYTRIAQYGLTEARYVVLMLGIWFSVCAGSAILLQQKFQLKHVTMLIAILALIASVGPYSAVNLSTQSQLERFKQTLQANQLWQNNHAVASTKTLALDIRRSLSSSADYMSRSTTRLALIKPWFNELLASSELKYNEQHLYSNGTTLMKLLNVEYTSSWTINNERQYLNFSQTLFAQNNPLDVSQYQKLMRFYLNVTSNKQHDNSHPALGDDSPQTAPTSASQTISTEINGQAIEYRSDFDGQWLSISQNKRELLSLDVKQLIQQRLKAQQTHISDENRRYFRLEVALNNWQHQLQLTSVNGYALNEKNGESDIVINSLEFYLLAGYQNGK